MGKRHALSTSQRAFLRQGRQEQQRLEAQISRVEDRLANLKSQLRGIKNRREEVLGVVAAEMGITQGFQVDPETNELVEVDE